MKSRSIALRVLLVLVAVTAVATAAVSALLYVQASRAAHEEAALRSRTLTTAIADDPFALEAVTSPDPAAALAGYADRLLEDTGTSFITIMAPDGTRYTHPDPAQVGRRYLGSRAEALAGRLHTETFTGTLGPSVRTIAPVRDEAGDVVALVATGITVERVSLDVAQELPLVVTLGAAVLVAGGLVSWLVGRYLGRTTFGLGPEELAQVHSLYDATLHTAQEGLVLVDPGGQVRLFNDRAAELLDLPAALSADDLPRPVTELGLPGSVVELVRSRRPVTDEVHVTGSRTLVVSQRPAVAGRTSRRLLRRDAGDTGSVLVLRDRTEVARLSGQLETTRTLATALRAQTHEHANRLHTVVSLLELGRTREALELAATDLARSRRLSEEVVSGVDEPYLSALLVSKAAAAGERGVSLDVVVAGRLGGMALPSEDLVTIVGNLVDNAVDAAAGSAEATVEVELSEMPDGLRIRVADTGPGLGGAAEELFALGRTGKAAGPEGRGLGLALVRQTVQRLGGTVHAYDDGGAVFVVELPSRADDGGPGSDDGH